MKFLALLFVLGAVVIGCSGDPTTNSAGNEVLQVSDKGGAQPSPNLPPPMTPGGGGQKTGKFKLGKS